MKNRFIQKERCNSYIYCLINYCLYKAVNYKYSISIPSGEPLSGGLHLEDLALKPPINIEQSRFKSLILERHKSRSPQVFKLVLVLTLNYKDLKIYKDK